MDAIRRRKLRVVAFFTMISTVMGVSIGTLFVAMGEPSFWPPRLGGIIGAIVGLGVGISEEFVVPLMGRTWGYYSLNAYRLILYAVMVTGSILGANAVQNSVVTDVTIWRGVEGYLYEGVLLRDVGFAAGAAVLAIIGLQLSKLYRVREIVQLLTGKYYHPVEEERVVLFVDIAGSSAIVERLGPLDASRFLRDCFADISEPILAWRGHVYQHLGDGVVVTWPDASSDSVMRSIKCFSNIRSALEDRKDYYLTRYQSAAQVRAGLHAGKVATTWVGEAKRELAVHGDALHVAARLQSRCREVDATCLVSDECIRGIELPEALEARDLGVLELHGRNEGVHCYDVREPATSGSNAT